MTHLRKMMLEELQRRHYSEATTRRYIRFIERFAQHFPTARPIAWDRSTSASTKRSSSPCTN